MSQARQLRESTDPPRLRIATPPSKTASPQSDDQADCNWMALHLPALPLQVFERGLQTSLPLAVSERERILACNAAAQRLGVRPGLRDGAARALTETLRIVRRCRQAERSALERLAAYALNFSNLVSLDQGDEQAAALVLEVGRSLRLFGGAHALQHQVLDAAEGLGWQVCCVLAPTPAAALLLARAGMGGLVGTHAAVRQALDGLSPALLVSDPQALDDLASMGVRTLGALLRLPRAGLAERFGLSLVQRIERLLGERADPQRPFVPPARFRAELELPAEVQSTDGLVFACRRLLDELGGFLTARQSAVQRIEWCLSHADSDATRFHLGTARLETDPDRWLELLRARLERLSLPRPVRAIALRSDELSPLPLENAELFDNIAPDPALPAALLDRLRARLGDRAVRGLALAMDHRPERAWCWRSSSVDAAPSNAGSRYIGPDKKGPLTHAERPIWLLPEPLLLEQRDQRPWLDGPLSLGSRCERIETGWWDGFEIARDYYIATAHSGERLWIYREMRGSRRWFLHGFMGLPES
jgi:protein ImuB